MDLHRITPASHPSELQAEAASRTHLSDRRHRKGGRGSSALIPTIVQVLRITPIDSPYPDGKRGLGLNRPDRQGGRYHLIATGAGVALQSGVLAAILMVNAARAAEREAAMA